MKIASVWYFIWIMWEKISASKWENTTIVKKIVIFVMKKLRGTYKRKGRAIYKKQYGHFYSTYLILLCE